MWIGFICEKTREKLSFEQCLECARTRINRQLNCPFDEATIEGMINQRKVKTDISVTQISGCHRATFINRHFDTYEYPSSMYYAFRGQIAHEVMAESAVHPDAIKEQQFFKEWEGIKISGTPDIVIPSQFIIKDYKTTKQAPSYMNKDGRILAYDGHRVQLNLYGWLVPHEILELEVIYFSMEETLICPVELWPKEATRKGDMTVDRYLEENLVPLHQALETDLMPPFKRNWACDEYCGVSDICYRELKKQIIAARRPKTRKGQTNDQEPNHRKPRVPVAAA